MSGFTGELTALEDRASVTSLEGLHAERKQILTEHGKLFALHASFGLFDAYRKRLLEALKVSERERLTTAGAKVTDAIVDAEAHAGDEYRKFLDNALDQKIQYITLQNRLTEIEEQIQDREIRLRLYGKELGL